MVDVGGKAELLFPKMEALVLGEVSGNEDEQVSFEAEEKYSRARDPSAQNGNYQW
jgi:hypothetical protein